MSEWELPKDIKSQSIERIGGDRIWDSGVYLATIKMVYLDRAESKAVSFNILIENADGKELKETMYIKSGETKGKKTYYTKDGNNYPLPGYAAANSMCIAATGESLANCIESIEKKQVKIYDYEQKKDVNQERPVVMCLLNKPVTVAVHKITEDKNKKSATGQYVPTGKIRNINECKFFGDSAGKTAEEIIAGSAAEKFTQWAEKNTGIVIDKSTKKEANSAAIMAGAASTKSTASMFDT